MNREHGDKFHQIEPAGQGDHARSDPFDNFQTKKSSEQGTDLKKVVLHRSILNDLPLIVISLIVCISTIRLSMFLNSPSTQVFGYDLLTVMAVSVVVGCSILSAIILYRRFNVRYVIADDGIKALRGILSNNQVDAKLEYYQIRGTEIHRSIFQRIIGTGDLHVRGSTGYDTEVSFKGIYDPYRYQKLIQERHRIEVQDPKSLSANLIKDFPLASSQNGV